MGDETRTEKVVITVPTEAEEFGIFLTPAELRRLDFSALDFVTMRRVLTEYIKTYFPEDFNDFVANNGIIMLMELLSYIGNNLSNRSDILVQESFLPTARDRVSVDQLLKLINNSIRRQTPAVALIEVTLRTGVNFPIEIPAGLQFNISGPDGQPVTYELYRTPGDFTSPVEIFTGRRGVIACGLEGRFATPSTSLSAGGANQKVRILADDILDEPITVTVGTPSVAEEYRRVDFIEKAEANDSVFEVEFIDGGMDIRFGDDVTGQAPLTGQTITVSYRVGGGIRGRIQTGAINEQRSIVPASPFNVPIQVLFRNIAPSEGGRDEESIEDAKKRAPLESATLDSATSGNDYAVLAATFSHPVFGSTLKSIAVIRTGIEACLSDLMTAVRAQDTAGNFVLTQEESEELMLSNYVNRNIVELYVLAEGADSNPVIPSKGLKDGLTSFLDDLNVLTDEVRVLDGIIKPIDLDATVIVDRTADVATVKEVVNKTIDDFFAPTNFEMGQALVLSQLYSAIQAVEGVNFVRIHAPVNDILASGELAENSPDNKVGMNELITLGTKSVKIFFARG